MKDYKQQKSQSQLHYKQQEPITASLQTARANHSFITNSKSQSELHYKQQKSQSQLHQDACDTTIFNLCVDGRHRWLCLVSPVLITFPHFYLTFSGIPHKKHQYLLNHHSTKRIHYTDRPICSPE